MERNEIYNGKEKEWLWLFFSYYTNNINNVLKTIISRCQVLFLKKENIVFTDNSFRNFASIITNGSSVDDFVNNDWFLKEMYMGKDVSSVLFLKEFRKRLSEYMGREIVKLDTCKGIVKRKGSKAYIRGVITQN